jgi:hypothetical protein
MQVFYKEKAMRKLISTVILVTMASIGNAAAEDNAGSNVTGSEKVCAMGVGAQNEQTLAEALKVCRRGDILDIGWLKIPVAMQLCDFTKAIVYHPATGSVMACVYTGTRRPVNK